MHYSQLTKSTIAGWKKKKKEENMEKKRRRGFHCKPNVHIKSLNHIKLTTLYANLKNDKHILHAHFLKYI